MFSLGVSIHKRSWLCNSMHLFVLGIQQGQEASAVLCNWTVIIEVPRHWGHRYAKVSPFSFCLLVIRIRPIKISNHSSEIPQYHLLPVKRVG